MAPNAREVFGGIWPYDRRGYYISMASRRVSSSNWLEHRTPNPRVAGSNPAWPATRFSSGCLNWSTIMDSLKSYLERSVSFVQESWTELAKVHFPTPRETAQATF